MFYNTYRATRSAMKRHQNPLNSRALSLNSRDIRLNNPKRQKLKNLLMTKFIQKYNIRNPDEFLDLVITQFIQIEEFNDNDLKKLDAKINRLNNEFNAQKKTKNNLKNTFNISNEEISKRPLQTEINNLSGISRNNKLNEFTNQTEGKNNINSNINTINNEDVINSNIKIKNLKNDFPSLNTYSNYVTNTEKNIKPRGYSSYVNRTHANYRKYSKSPEEELAELEKEFAEEELIENQKYKNKYERIDFSNQGDEWKAILNYNKKLYQRQLLEQKLKDKNEKESMKNFLDKQVKEKLQKKWDEKNQEREFDRKVNEYLKNIDEKDNIKSTKKMEQIKRLKLDRDNILKNETMKKKIEQLKQKKFDKMLVNNYKANIEQEKNEKIEKKKRGKSELLKLKKEIENKRKLNKEKIEKEKKDDMMLYMLKDKIDQRKENERNLYYTKIRSLSRKYLLPNAEKMLEKMQKDKREEDEKIQHFYDEKNKYEFEKEYKAKIKRLNDKMEIKKFLDMQIEEKKKEKTFLKLLDQEQARIWKLDLNRRFDEMKLEEQCMKSMNKKNFEYILKQIEEKKRNKELEKSKKMSDNEYAINRDLLEKANEDYLKSCDNK